MKILTYNINGLRAALRKGLAEWLKHTEADVVCFQEIKALPSQIDTDFWTPLGYHAYWFPAQKKGYSGVLTLSKEKPRNVDYGCGKDLYDQEGRILSLHFDTLSVMNVYAPSGTSGGERQTFKMTFLDFFYEFVQDLMRKNTRWVINGDFNICHEAIDIHDPVGNKKSSGFLPEERAWLSKFLQNGLTDTFRHLHPEQPHHYSWWSHRANARARNLGWRIDYQVVSAALLDRVKSCLLLPEAMHSDHCPQRLQLA